MIAIETLIYALMGVLVTATLSILLKISDELVDISNRIGLEISEITEGIRFPEIRGEVKPIDEEAILGVVSGAVALGGGGAVADEVTYENILYAINLYNDLPYDLQCQALAMFYEVFSNVSTINELSQDMFSENYQELTEDEMKVLIMQFASEYDFDTATSCLNLFLQVQKDVMINKAEGHNDSKNEYGPKVF